MAGETFTPADAQRLREKSSPTNVSHFSATASTDTISRLAAGAGDGKGEHYSAEDFPGFKKNAGTGLSAVSKKRKAKGSEYGDIDGRIEGGLGSQSGNGIGERFGVENLLTLKKAGKVGGEWGSAEEVRRQRAEEASIWGVKGVNDEEGIVYTPKTSGKQKKDRKLEEEVMKERKEWGQEWKKGKVEKRERDGVAHMSELRKGKAKEQTKHEGEYMMETDHPKHEGILLSKEEITQRSRKSRRRKEETGLQDEEVKEIDGWKEDSTNETSLMKMMENEWATIFAEQQHGGQKRGNVKHEWKLEDRVALNAENEWATLIVEDQIDGQKERNSKGKTRVEDKRMDDRNNWTEYTEENMFVLNAENEWATSFVERQATVHFEKTQIAIGREESASVIEREVANIQVNNIQKIEATTHIETMGITNIPADCSNAASVPLGEQHSPLEDVDDEETEFEEDREETENVVEITIIQPLPANPIKLPQVDAGEIAPSQMMSTDVGEDVESSFLLNFNPDQVITREKIKDRSSLYRTTLGKGPKEAPIKTRSYQQEMFEESLKQNIIICQPTGSGKTHIAILRIRHELESSPPDQISWFLAPNKPLAEQQFRVLERELPPVPMRLLSGSDGVEKWDLKIWNQILCSGDDSEEQRVRVVVSTHQILLDALSHGYVTMDNLCLLVFDEAHYCIGSHPANMIMKEFYHPALNRGEKVPAIMGLTASPLFNGGIEQLKTIESNLAAICRTPTTHRSIMDNHSILPTLKPVGYSSLAFQAKPLPAMSYSYLINAYETMDINKDPYVQSLPRETAEDESQYWNTIKKQDTYCRNQMKTLKNKYEHVVQEYGSWAADYFLHAVIERFTTLVQEKGEELVGWVDAEKLYLLNIFSTIKTFSMTDEHLMLPGALTPKVEKLIAVLLEEYSRDSRNEGSSFAGLIFVEQRVGVSILTEILSRHPKTKDIFQCGTLVGMSTNNQRQGKSMAELVDLKATMTSLEDFKNGTKNLIIATSVAEEGIDVQACHLVVCTYVPKTKKSYVQMRGRARRVESTYVLMYETEEQGQASIKNLDNWEKEMVKAYQDQTRQLEEKEELELDDDESEYDRYYIEQTKALLTYHSAIPHLHHFCAVIPYSASLSLKPEFFTHKLGEETGYWMAEAKLPSCIPPELRSHKAAHTWRKEKTAIQDVAFQAYTALHKAGLVDDHLMPFPTDDPELEMDEIAKKTDSEEVPQQLDPWETTWKSNHRGEIEMFVSRIRIKWESGEIIDMKMFLPFPVPRVGEFDLWWTNTEAVRICVEKATVATFMPPAEFAETQNITYILFSSVFGGRMEKNRRDFPYLFTPFEDSVSADKIPALDYYEDWDSFVKGDIGIVRDLSQNSKPYLFKAWNYEATVPPEDMEKRWKKYELIPGKPLLEVNPIPKRRNFSHRYMNTKDIEEEEEERARVHNSQSIYLLPQACTFDKLPWRLARATLLIPCILRRVEIYAIAQELQNTVLAPVGLQNIDGIVTAITATSSREWTHYQKYEILGDSVLKFLAGMQLLAEYPLWHEGYLSGKKDRSVANSKLAAESIRLGMARFIVTNMFTAQKWRPKYLPSTPSTTPEDGELSVEADAESEVALPVRKGQRKLSTKTLADIVESLIGAAYLEGSFDAAVKVAETFGLGMRWDTLSTRSNILAERAATSKGLHFPTYLRLLETMIGYEFKQKSLLLEALTHPGCTTDTISVSYQRMEFLGDSVLDMVIVNRLFHHPKDLGHVDIHLYKSASVNADFLAFLCLDMSLIIPQGDMGTTVDRKTDKVVVHTQEKTVHLYKFLRQDTHEVAVAQKGVWKNYVTLRDQITAALNSSPDYPWTLLAGLSAEKFISDMMESILGAVFVDSLGNWTAVEGVMDKMGILSVLDSMLERGVDTRHPVSKLGIYAAKSLSTVKYVQRVENKQYSCAVTVNDEQIVKIIGGPSKQEVRTRAAEMAYWEMMRRDMEKKAKEAQDRIDKDKPDEESGKETKVEKEGEPKELDDLVSRNIDMGINKDGSNATDFIGSDGDEEGGIDLT